MRRSVLFVLVLVLAGCGDDDGDDAEVDDGNVEADARDDTEGLGEDPSREECLEALGTAFAALEVPEGVDPSDGLDEAERAATEEMGKDAYRQGGLDPEAEQNPCDDVVTADDLTTLNESLAPEVRELLEAAARREFSSTGSAIN